MKCLPAVLLALLLGGACAHTKKISDLESLKPTVEGFHQFIRWKDFRAASRSIVPERRESFTRARLSMKDDQDLSVLDYEIEDVKLSADGMRATVQSRIQWMRLPSVTAHNDLVTSEFIFRDGAWMLERQLEGPFAGELP